MPVGVAVYVDGVPVCEQADHVLVVVGGGDPPLEVRVKLCVSDQVFEKLWVGERV